MVHVPTGTQSGKLLMTTTPVAYDTFRLDGLKRIITTQESAFLSLPWRADTHTSGAPQ